MRRVFARFVTTVVVLAACGTALVANGAQSKVDGDADGKQGVSTVTDGAGNPVDTEAAAVGKRAVPRRISGGSAVPEVQRGQAWWPYQTPVGAYNDAARSVERLTEDEIQINGVAVLNIRDPQSTLDRLPKDLRVNGGQVGGDGGYYLVKIRGFSRTQVEVDALQAAGAILGEYLNVNTYIAKIPTAGVSAVRALPFVSYVGDYQPAYKISPRIGLERIPQNEAYDQVTGREKPWLLDVVLHKGADVNEVLGHLAGLSIFPGHADVVSNDDFSLVLARTAPEFIPMLAQIPGVKWIEERTYPHLDASPTSPTVNPVILQNNGVFTTNTALGWKLWNAGIDGDASGTPQIVTLMDSGLNTNVEHFAQDTAGVGTIGPSHRKVVGYDNYGGDVCVNDFSTADGGHGTSTSQHAVGGISNMTSNPDVTHTPTNFYDNGIAPMGKVYFQDIGTAAGSLNPPADMGPAISAAIGKGSYIQNHSWGAATATYSSRAASFDTAIFNNQGMIVTMSAGNGGVAGGGTIDDNCTAKNGICVGGSDPGSPSSLFLDCSWDGNSGTCSGSTDLGSARGPVLTSNRIKPDILGYMANRSSVGGEFEAEERSHAMCQTDGTKTVYWDWVNSSNTGGTSFSAPEVAGLAALVRDYFLAGYYPTGTATPANAITPSGSLVKAIILASGEDMGTTGWPTTTLTVAKRYSSDVGYGRANLPAALHIGGSAPFLWVQNGDTLGDGSTKTFFYNINSNSIPLRVMLSYYDASGNALQKDIDLKVTIGANVYLGNNLSSGWSATGGTADRTNNTEGVFLDAAHGLPASGQVKVEVIGFNDPGGIVYSLAVVGDVANAAVTQVFLDQGKYTCNDTIKVTVNDASATSPVNVTLTSRNAASTVIDTQIVSCTGGGGVFIGTIVAGSGIIVADGGTVTATYLAVAPAVSNIDCKMAADDGGFILGGGCDNTSAGTDAVQGPLFNGGSNEFYTRYMDAGEFTSYTFGFVNQTGADLTDTYVSLSFTGAGASKMTVLNNPIHVGAVGAGDLTGAVFQVKTDPTATGLTAVNMEFDITSPADGYTTAKHLIQAQLLQANDTVSRQASCNTFNTNTLLPYTEVTASGAVANVWRASLGASTPTTVSAENRTDGSCNSGIAGSMMVGNSGTANNFANNADSFLLLNFQPALRGNGPSGQPYRYTWKWHSFYHASEANLNQGGVWGAFYNNAWNNPVAPTGDEISAFPIVVCCYYHTIFDYPSQTAGTWNWETANTGTPDNPALGPSSGGAPNQLIISFLGISGTATSSTYFSYGHEHADIFWFNGGTSHGTHRDVALDNDRLVYDEYYAASQAGASCAAGQVGLVAFDRYAYNECPGSSAIISVTDANAVGPLTAVVSSPGTGDSETVTLTGAGPYFSGTIATSTSSGGGFNNGVLLVLPSETITVSYTDASPVGTSTASAQIGCVGGDVVYLSNAQISDNGDNDGIPDNNESVILDLTIRNNMATPLTNAKVTIFSNSPNIACVDDGQALYGTVPAGGSATNPAGDRFKFHVAAPVQCADWSNPPRATFTVLITGDGINGAATSQTFSLSLDLDNQAGGTYTYTQDFTSDPGWSTGATPDDDNNVDCSSAPTWLNHFHWCAACGNGSGGYGAWIGNSAFGTVGQNYTDFDSSTLYSPVFTAAGNVTMQFSIAYRTETTWDGAIVQYSLNSGAWTTLPYTTPAQAATTAGTCQPLPDSTQGWTGNGTTWTTTNAASATASNGQLIQFRWRLGTDSSVVGSSYGGLGVDNVSITNLRQTQACEATRNTGLPPCVPDCTTLPNGSACDDGSLCTTGDACAGGVCTGTPISCDDSNVCTTDSCSAGSGCAHANNTNACNDGNACTQTDVCSGGSCVGSNPLPAPGVVDNGVQVNKSGTDANLSWNLASNASTSDLLRGDVSALPVGPGGGDEVCFGGLGGTTATDASVPASGTGYWYLVRGHNACSAGSYGTQGVNGSPGAARASTTCP